MRVFDISLFTFVVLLSIGAVDQILGTGTVAGSVSSTAPDPGGIIREIPETSEGGLFWQSVTLLVNSLSILVGVLGVALNVGGYLQGIIPILPTALCAALSAGVDLIYVMGIIQFVTGRSEKLMG